MRNIFIVAAAISLFTANLYAANGDLVVSGSVKVGQTSDVCSINLTGAVRWDTVSSQMQYCDGAAWAPIGAPTGTVIYSAANVCPSGYLKANGAVVSRTTYAALFAAIGTTYGAGDGSTTFRLPDLRGEFVRGWDDGRGVDTGRLIGSWQADLFGSHTHTGTVHYGTGTTATHRGVADYANTTGLTTIGAAGGIETRPRNIALLACIKY